MKVLVTHEESQEVCKAFRKFGHEAYSCDIQDCSGGHPEWHLKMDAEKAIVGGLWGLIIMHPMCTKIAASGNAWFGQNKAKHSERLHAVAYTLQLWNTAKKICNKVCLENPVGVLNRYTLMPNPQYIQPWQFGHQETKKTGLWLHGLPKLTPTNIVGPPPRPMTMADKAIWNKVHRMSPGPDRAKKRSKTFSGIAAAMAEQWG